MRALTDPSARQQRAPAGASAQLWCAAPHLVRLWAVLYLRLCCCLSVLHDPLRKNSILSAKTSNVKLHRVY